MLVGLSLVLVLFGLGTFWSCNQRSCEAASTSILPLGSSWHLDLSFAGHDIPSSSTLSPWRPFLRGENQMTELRVLGVLSTIPFLQEESTGAVTSAV